MPPCLYSKPIFAYFNREEVRTALHIVPEAKKWDYCSDNTTGFYYTPLKEASQDIYVWLKPKGLKILKYSGDTDGAVPTYGTQQWIRELNWEVKDKWHAFTVGEQAGGYVEVRDGLTFVTVHGAGHMAPQWRRAPTYKVIFNFIKDVPI